MGETRPLTSENFVRMDVDDSRVDFNDFQNTDDAFRERKDTLFSKYNVNGRLIVAGFSVVCFIFTLILFISTIVVYYSHPIVPSMNDGCNLDAYSAQVQEQKAIAASQGKISFNDRHGKNYPAQQIDSDIDLNKNDSFNALEWSVTKVNGEHVRPGKLVYEDNFDTFNTTNWEHVQHDSSSSFFQFVNNRSNSYVKDGILYMKPTFTVDTHGEEYVYNGTLLLGRYPSDKCKTTNMSALCWKNAGGIVHPILAPMITTEKSFNFLYGRLVIRAKMPGGDWIEPLLTLQPNMTTKYGNGLLSGQIQMIDTRGNKKLFNQELTNVGSEQTCPDLRFGNSKEKRILYDCLSTYPEKGFDTDFHVYEVLWTPDSITLKIDDEGIVSAPNPRSSMFKLWSRGRKLANPWHSATNHKMAPFDQSFYLALGVNVGGTNGFFHDDYESPYPKPWKNDDPQAPKTFWEGRNNWAPSWSDDKAALQIDYIRLYSLNTTVTTD